MKANDGLIQPMPNTFHCRRSKYVEVLATIKLQVWMNLAVKVRLDLLAKSLESALKEEYSLCSEKKNKT